MDTKAAILEQIKRGHRTATEIARNLGLTPGAISQEVKRLTEEGLVSKRGREYFLNEGPENCPDDGEELNETNNGLNETSSFSPQGGPKLNEQGSFRSDKLNESPSFRSGQAAPLNEDRSFSTEGTPNLNEAASSRPGLLNEDPTKVIEPADNLNEGQTSALNNPSEVIEKPREPSPRPPVNRALPLEFVSPPEFLAFTLPNLSAQRITRQSPLEFRHPGYGFGDKKSFRAWCAHPETEHCFFNLTEGLEDHLRVSHTNEATFLWGIVADYDASLNEESLQALISPRKGHLLPCFGSRTFSGGARLVWLFEQRMPIHSPVIAKKVIEKAKRSLGLTAMLPGLDEKALADLSQYYELGTGWEYLGGSPVPASTVFHWIESVSTAKLFKRTGVSIPLDQVARVVEERFPGRWQGPFVEGARGIRFWDPQADALSVIVRDSGCQCFTGDKPFLSWADIFGRDFVERFQEKKIGGAIEQIYFDGRLYWRRLEDRSWQAMNASTAGRHLRVEFEIDPEPYGETASELDRVLHEIEQRKFVYGALPFVHCKETLVTINKRTYLNIASTRCIEPVTEPQPWGASFPFLAQYLEGLLEAGTPRDTFLAWLHRFYASAFHGHLAKGQALFLAGPVGVGKTLLSECTVAPLVGGKQEATDFLLGGSSFNKELFEYALWTIDDDPVSGDPKAHLRFSNLVKKVAANHTFNYHAKFRDQLTVPWNGRILVTCNDDPESIRILPDLDVSIKDKLILLKVAPKAPTSFPPDAAGRIRAELPFFARWLLDFEIPAELQGTSRFGVASYIDPSLEEIAKHSSVTNSFAEILSLWRENYFSSCHEPLWQGTAAELNSALVVDDTVKPLVQGSYNVISIGRRLCAMINQGYPWVAQRRCGQNGARVFFIYPGEGSEPSAALPPLPPSDSDEDPF